MFRYIFLIFGLCIIFVPSLAKAEGSIGVVDVVHILSNSKAAQSIQEQREKQRELFLKEISESEQALRAEEKALSEARMNLPQDEYTKKRQAYEEKLFETRKLAQNKKRMLEEASNTAMNALREQLTVIVQEIAKERGYELVISNKNVLTGENSLDITQETIKRLNERLQSVPIVIHHEDPAPVTKSKE